MDWMRSGLISSLATPWPEGASTARLAAGWRLAGMGLRADFFAALDGLVVFAPPERIAQEQLSILRRIEGALRANAPPLDAASPLSAIEAS